MQTFMPYSDFELSAMCLDWQRLGKQRSEAQSILNIITGKAKKNKYGKVSWSNHPAVLMWKGYEEALRLYFNVILREWKSRGYKNTMVPEPFDERRLIVPKWFGDERFHLSHQSNLLRKNFQYYSKFGWKVDPEMEYFWPTHNGY